MTQVMDLRGNTLKVDKLEGEVEGTVTSDATEITVGENVTSEGTNITILAADTLAEALKKIADVADPSG